VGQLARKRIDGFIADRRFLDEVISAWPSIDPQIRIQFLRFSELGVYFGRDYLARDPRFLPRFNEAIGECQQLVLNLSERERDHLIALTEQFVDVLRAQPLLINALIASNEIDQTAAEVQQLDQQWRAEYQSGAYQLIARYQARELSAWLMDIAVSEQDGFTEILAFDRLGRTVGMSRITSDYDQSDEAKFQQTLGRESITSFIDDVRYDRSTQRFQTQLTAVITDEDGDALGAITVGLDVEALLSGVTVPVSLVLQYE